MAIVLKNIAVSGQLQIRIKRDEEDVVKLVAQFERYGVFRQITDLVAVTTSDVASDDIKNDLLQAQE